MITRRPFQAMRFDDYRLKEAAEKVSRRGAGGNFEVL
jgi:hypothetical protein